MKTTLPQTQNLHDETYWLMILSYFAAFLVGFGIIALVAANWEQISNNVKLGGAVGLMIVNTLGVWATIKFDKPVLKQVLCAVYAFLIMAVIGLIGQVFQLPSDIGGACLLWAVCAWPLFLVTPRLLWLWIPIFLLGTQCFASFKAIDVIGLLPYSAKTLSASDCVLTLFSFYGLVFVYELWMLYAKPANKTVERPLRFYCGYMMLSAVVLCEEISPLPKFSLLNTSLFYSGFLLAAMLIFYLNKKQKRISFMPYFLLGCIVESLLLRFNILKVSVESVLMLTSLLLMWGYAYYHKMPRFRYLILFALLVWLFATFEGDILNLVPSLMICAALAVYAYLNNSRRLFDVAVLAAIIRLLSYYAEAGNLTYLGIYLICSGLLLLGTIFAMIKVVPLLWEKRND